MTTNNLTIIVKDFQNKLVKDANVTLAPGNLTGKTDETGQVIFPLPQEKKVEVTVELNGETNKITYYITGSSDQRLEINFAFNKKIQESQSTSPSLVINNKSQNPTHTLDFFLILLVIVLCCWLFLKKYRRSSYR